MPRAWPLDLDEANGQQLQAPLAAAAAAVDATGVAQPDPLTTLVCAAGGGLGGDRGRDDRSALQAWLRDQADQPT